MQLALIVLNKLALIKLLKSAWLIRVIYKTFYNKFDADCWNNRNQRNNKNTYTTHTPHTRHRWCTFTWWWRTFIVHSSLWGVLRWRGATLKFFPIFGFQDLSGSRLASRFFSSKVVKFVHRTVSVLFLSCCRNESIRSASGGLWCCCFGYWLAGIDSSGRVRETWIYGVASGSVKTCF